jgi:uncharacterized membrane protein
VNRKSIDLIAVAVFAALAMTLTLQAPAGSLARLLVTLPLALFLPGYALIAAMFPGRTLGFAERLLFSVGLSLTLTVLGGLVLYWTSLGVRPVAWAVLLGNITLLAALIALVRSWRRPLESMALVRLRPLQGAQLLLALLLVVGALQLARDGAAARRDAGFTQLWMLPAGVSQAGSVRLGISNYEAQAMRYRLRVSAGTMVLGEWQQVALAPDQQWEAQLALPAQTGTPTIEATLYRLDAPETVYRRVVFWRGEQQ